MQSLLESELPLDARRGKPQGKLETESWEAILVKTQNDTAPGILGTLARFRDPRVRHVVPRRLPERSVGGYEVTDWAIALARGEWLVVTNADNLYSPDFLRPLLTSGADVVAYDWRRAAWAFRAAPRRVSAYVVLDARPPGTRGGRRRGPRARARGTSKRAGAASRGARISSPSTRAEGTP